MEPMQPNRENQKSKPKISGEKRDQRRPDINGMDQKDGKRKTRVNNAVINSKNYQSWNQCKRTVRTKNLSATYRAKIVTKEDLTPIEWTKKMEMKKTCK